MFLPVLRYKKPKKACWGEYHLLGMVLRSCKALSGLPAGLVKRPGGFAVTKQILGGVEEIQRCACDLMRSRAAAER